MRRLEASIHVRVNFCCICNCCEDKSLGNIDVLLYRSVLL